MKLRPYQQDAHDAATEWIRRSIEPALIIAPTASGKSWINAAIAKTVIARSDKKVLCLAPNGDLVGQNYEKWLMTGEPASIYSASLGRKELRHKVVFGSPKSVVNNLQAFGGQFAAILIDEAHGLTPTLFKIIDNVRSGNPNVRVIGMTATPHRMGSGYIYQYGPDDAPMEFAEKPYFFKAVYDIPARMLIDEGYLCPPTTIPTVEHYDTSGLVLTSLGQWSADSVDRAFHGNGRKTSDIVADIVAKSCDRKGVFIFAASVKHAQEIMESLPRELSALIASDAAVCTKEQRETSMKRFKSGALKYAVSVRALATGVDIPHFDVCAIMCKTESPGLLQQMIGRVLRLSPSTGKTDGLVLDYGENIAFHFPGGDIFSPDIRSRAEREQTLIDTHCPECGGKNTFSARDNGHGYGISDDGYFTDLMGHPVGEPPMPAHFGRRCNSYSMRCGLAVRCVYQWTSKPCESCGEANDIAARYCCSCKAEIIDPNEKLRREAAVLANDQFLPKTANVHNWDWVRHKGKEGRADTLRVQCSIDQAPYNISRWYSEGSYSWADLMTKCGLTCKTIDEAIIADKPTPVSIVYARKKDDSKFYEIKAYKF